VTVEISGEVGCWFLACGSLFGVSSFRTMCGVCDEICDDVTTVIVC
jgi:hypothetical protein